MDELNSMGKALYDALYVRNNMFQWITFTRFGVVAGQYSRWFEKYECKLAKKVVAM